MTVYISMTRQNVLLAVLDYIDANSGCSKTDVKRHIGLAFPVNRHVAMSALVRRQRMLDEALKSNRITDIGTSRCACLVLTSTISRMF